MNTWSPPLVSRCTHTPRTDTMKRTHADGYTPYAMEQWHALGCRELSDTRHFGCLLMPLASVFGMSMALLPWSDNEQCFLTVAVAPYGVKFSYLKPWSYSHSIVGIFVILSMLLLLVFAARWVGVVHAHVCVGVYMSLCTCPRAQKSGSLTELRAKLAASKLRQSFCLLPSQCWSYSQAKPC